MILSKVPGCLLQPAVHQRLGPKSAHACICVTISHTIGLAVPLALPLAQRLSCQRHKSATFGTGKRFGSQENSYWTIALPAESVQVWLLGYIIIRMSLLPLSPPSRPEGWSWGKSRLIQTDLVFGVCVCVCFETHWTKNWQKRLCDKNCFINQKSTGGKVKPQCKGSTGEKNRKKREIQYCKMKAIYLKRKWPNGKRKPHYLHRL